VVVVIRILTSLIELSDNIPFICGRRRRRAEEGGGRRRRKEERGGSG